MTEGKTEISFVKQCRVVLLAMMDDGRIVLDEDECNAVNKTVDILSRYYNIVKE